jgi:site-specific recombinase XerD
MSLIAATLQSFFTDRLAKQRRASPRTIACYRDSLRMLVVFVHKRTGKRPSTLDWDDLDTEMICDFLDHLETDRGNSARTRNLRLTAIRSLFAYASLRHPEHAGLIQRVLAIPAKRFDKPIVSFLTATQIDALIHAPDLTRWEGRRDRALLLVAVQTGLRVSELTGLDCGDVTLGTGANVRCEGKGRKHRAVPLTTATATVLGVWLAERAGRRDEPLFPTRAGRRLSSDAVERLVHKHAATAATRCPSLRAQKVHPHTLRHSCAMSLLHAGVDTAVIALWMGHADIRSTHTYLHADMTIKQRALELIAPTSTPPGRYQPTDSLLAFLEGL